MKIGIYPGTFDPPTLGHLDIIKRSYSIFDEFIILVMNNYQKKNLLEYQVRVNYLNIMIKTLSQKIKIKYYNGPLLEYINKITKTNINVYIIRGLRNTNDFNYEYNMYLVNQSLYNNFEILFLLSKNEFNFVSSSVIKEMLFYNLDIKKFVHEKIYKDLKKKYKKLS